MKLAFIGTGTIIALVVVAIIVLIALSLAIWGVSTANKFKVMKVKIDEAESDIDVALTKRYDLLTKQKQVVKGFMGHEKDTFVSLTAMRTGNKDIKTLSEVNAQLDTLAKQITVQVENYPDLKSNQVFSNLQAAANDVEEHLQAARRLYNSNVSRYNQSIIVFPSSIIAGMVNATKVDFFEVEEEKKDDVDLSL